MSTIDQSDKKKRFVRWVVAFAGSVIVVLALAAIPYSNVPKRGGEAFGRIAKEIKGNPGATAAVSIGAGAVLWLAVGLLVAGQEWLIARRRVH